MGKIQTAEVYEVYSNRKNGNHQDRSGKRDWGKQDAKRTWHT